MHRACEPPPTQLTVNQAAGVAVNAAAAAAVQLANMTVSTDCPTVVPSTQAALSTLIRSVLFTRGPTQCLTTYVTHRLDSQGSSLTPVVGTDNGCAIVAATTEAKTSSAGPW
jgi:hypothetical protein